MPPSSNFFSIVAGVGAGTGTSSILQIRTPFPLPLHAQIWPRFPPRPIRRPQIRPSLPSSAPRPQSRQLRTYHKSHHILRRPSHRDQHRRLGPLIHHPRIRANQERIRKQETGRGRLQRRRQVCEEAISGVEFGGLSGGLWGEWVCVSARLFF